MKGYPQSQPSSKPWSTPYRFEGWPITVPCYCPRCGEHQGSVPFGRPHIGMCRDCKAISHLLSQRKYRGDRSYR